MMNRFNLGLFKEFNLEQDEGGQIMTVFIFAQTIQVICFQWIRRALFQKNQVDQVTVYLLCSSYSDALYIVYKAWHLRVTTNEERYIESQKAPLV